MSTNSEIFRFHTRAQIKEGQVANFKANMRQLLIPVVRDEPDTLQCEVFFHDETRTAAWMWTFTSVQGSIDHMANPAMAPVMEKTLPLMDLNAFRAIGPMPEDFAAHLRSLGMPLQQGRALPGVQRLAEEPTSGFGLQVNFEATWNDTAEVARIASLMHGATLERDGVRQLQYVDFGDSTINVYMAYRSAKDFAEWAYSPAARYAADLLPDLLTSVKTEVYGEVDDDAAREELDNWQAIYFDRLDGFVSID